MKTPFSIFLFFSICLHLSPCFSEDAFDEFKACGLVYNCGELVNIKYPFWGNERPGYCGAREFKLNCTENKTTMIEIDSHEYIVLEINQTNQRMKIARADLFNDYCPEMLIKTATLNYDLYEYLPNNQHISIWYDCQVLPGEDFTENNSFICDSNGRNRGNANYFFKEPMPADLIQLLKRGCRMNIEVTVTMEELEEYKENKTASLENALKQGFDVGYKNLNTIACEECKESGGNCGSNQTYLFYCICRNRNAHPYLCTTKARPNRRIKALIALITSVGLVGMMIIFICYIWKIMLNKEETEKIIRKYATDQTPKRYSYSKVKKITSSFKNKLGQGGFSIVYKGKLPDGRDVAVKLLNEYKQSGHDFINEVVSIAQTSHVNIVTLLGFCYERRKRALIYEYMPKGSLDKYTSRRVHAPLDWNTWHSIAIGIARGLEYLHRGCNTKIFHFDIKPHNILLDNTLCPKISDFGLAKQCKANESHVTMTGAKGTPGFIAPEQIFRNFGKVSHKSDVYSYGMLVLDMIGERKNPNPNQGISESSDEYFPDWIYEDLTKSEDGDFQWGNTEEEEGVARKMIIVGLNCIQTLPDERPSMTDVVSMLEASLDSLQIPPKPTLSLPPMLPQPSSSSTS